MKNQTLIDKITQQAEEGVIKDIAVTGGCVFKTTQIHEPLPIIYEPMICLIVQGTKNCHIGDRTFTYSAGDLFINFLPLPVEAEIVQASENAPLLSVAMKIDLVKLADMILKIERAKPEQKSTKICTATSVVTGPAPTELVALFEKMLDVANCPLDAAILGDAMIDEIYYRLLTSHYGVELRVLLNQYGQIQPISRAVNYIHANMSDTIQVSELAAMTNMSKTAFFNSFKKIMHVAPNQYIKSTKLRKAQTLLSKGVQATEACYQVGYNSFSQFSREYKRLFGFPPSETLQHL